MSRWLAVTAALWLFASSGAQAQMKGLAAPDVAQLAKNRTLDLRISIAPETPRSSPLVSGMLVHRDVGPNAAFGLGLADMYQKRRSGDYRAGDPPVRSRRPAATFVMRF